MRNAITTSSSLLNTRSLPRPSAFDIQVANGGTFAMQVIVPVPEPS